MTSPTLTTTRTADKEQPRSPSPADDAASTRSVSVPPERGPSGSPHVSRAVSAEPNPPIAKLASAKPASAVADPVKEQSTEEEPDDTKATEEEEEVDETGGDHIDMETFEQILELDEDEERSFSRGMVWEYFDQAQATFGQMDEAYKKDDTAELSRLGHFLKGSSAALGLAKLQASCEKIQHYGQLQDHDSPSKGLLAKSEALEKIRPLLSSVKVEYIVAEKWLKNWYAKNSTEDT
ncbi:histidine-phosphotransfer domain HPT domain-containing protein [Coniophora puteana RWD-64-598 SS2]|uniref:Histidine-phosphotransfer domain HPT domain-containing protein n=1 Tax=Coniophora puteana (strain RWD-64-598) TaxID=741705 RepID=A0A5M3MRV7_CONPW|nr:histidine-phosphotransfer domain HPT domain-containing protein [Coniophora puteana RWD-64-598 SS2]EIW81281.1 histidine-phosphotransfer domain HPT domain-containing protein [Coniophora puteana RWD-64-598 SS2]